MSYDKPLPSPQAPLANDKGLIQPDWFEYLKERHLPGPLVDAVNDAAAAAAGVPVGAFYANAGAVRIRLT